MRKDPKSTKNHQCLFALLGSVRVKAVLQMYVKLTIDLEDSRSSWNSFARGNGLHQERKG